MIFTNAAKADFPAIVELVNLAYRGGAQSPGWTNESSYLEGPRLTETLLEADLAAKPLAHLMTLRHQPRGLLLGTGWLEPKAADLWYLGLLTVRPELQHQQLGRALLAASEDFAARRGALRMRMTVINIRETLIAWYQRRGYERTGETQPFPYGDTRFGIPLRDDLSFVVLEKELVPSSRVLHRENL